jgi:N-ethylmaleimide reductase
MSNTSSKILFTPLKLGALQLSHRIIMAPLTRTRATDRFVPSDTAIDYYSERASRGGLIITEAVPISPEGMYEYAPGIYTEEQEGKWKAIVDAVHARGGLISIQLWHVGRSNHPSWGNHEFIKSLGRPLPSVSASNVVIKNSTTMEYPSMKHVPYQPPRPLSTEEVRSRLIDDYRRAAKAAKRCGFDAVEIHAAHGYLINQFMCTSTNQRTDEFGGSLPNRLRLLHLVVEAVCEIMGNDRVGIRLSPTYTGGRAYYEVEDENPELLYRTAVASLDKYGLAYLLLSEPRWTGGKVNNDPRTDTGFTQPLRNIWAKQLYRGPVIGAGGFTPQTAKLAMEQNLYDAVAFGRWFISNPDLVEKLQTGSDLTIYDRKTFYIRDPVLGYVDYPILDSTSNNKKAGKYPIRYLETMKQQDIGLNLASSSSTNTTNNKGVGLSAGGSKL